MNVIELTKRLCAISSITGDEILVVNEVDKILCDLGFTVKRQQVGDKPGRDNLFAYSDSDKPTILLTTHLDTVAPHFATSLSADGEWLVGRGVCDAKGAAAAMIIAASELQSEGQTDVGLLFVVGEETHSDGAKAINADFIPSVKYFIDGEPTDLKLTVGMKGAIVFDLEATGQAGHSAYPETGHSAIHQLCSHIQALIAHQWPVDHEFGATTINIGKIEGGVGGNVIAPSAWASGVMRTSVDAGILLKQMEQILNTNRATKLIIKSASSPVRLHDVEGFEKCVVAFGSDVPHLAHLGTPLLIGPGSIFDAHTAGEKVRVRDLQQAVVVYKELCRKLLTQ